MNLRLTRAGILEARREMRSESPMLDWTATFQTKTDPPAQYTKIVRAKFHFLARCIAKQTAIDQNVIFVSIEQAAPEVSA